jgi:subtilisin family serine protease
VAGLGGDHGTQCAGTATAVFDNNSGIAGVAPNCRLIGARIPNPSTGVQMADAFLWAAGINNGNATPGFPALPAQPADVISNSWGVSNAALSTALQNAFDRLTDDARDGRGCVVTFSTGNLGYVQFTNVRRFAAYERNMAVGASINVNPTSPVNSSQPDPNGNTNNIAVAVDTRALYNPFGPEMDVVAPSHTCYDAGGNLVDPTTSTVRVGNGALDGCPGPATCFDYATNFGGTSHASPTIAGTAALILSVFPLLAWNEARAVLRRTAVRIDAAQADAIGQYVDNDGDGTREFSQWYGYGRIDVAEAVRETAKLAVATFQAWS